MQGFKDYLDKDAKAWAHDFRKHVGYHPLARNSKLSFFNKLRACLNQTFNERIAQCVYKATINKKITFHCARQTFAVVMLDLGADLYTVSKFLGHKLIITTQIHAKVLDKNKQAAVPRIPTILGKPSEGSDDKAQN